MNSLQIRDCTDACGSGSERWDISMNFFRNNDKAQATLNAIGKSQAVIEFNLDGTIITANQNFCAAMGYALSEIQGKHHSMLVDPAYKYSAEYRQFW